MEVQELVSLARTERTEMLPHPYESLASSQKIKEAVGCFIYGGVELRFMGKRLEKSSKLSSFSNLNTSPRVR